MVSKNVRYFGNVRESAEIPDLVAIQKRSYERFLQKDVAPTRRKCIGLESLFRELFPIESYDKSMVLEYLHYELEKPHYTLTQCRQLRLTYGYPLKITCRLRSKDGEGQPAARAAWLEGIGWVGQFFVAITFGALFSGVYLAAITALIERISYLWNLFGTVLPSLFS